MVPGSDMMGDRPRTAPQPVESDGLGFERLVFFSDAVFAIAMTLLVVDLRLPEVAGRLGDDELAHAIAELGPRIFAYGLSFSVIGFYWLAHWRRYQLVKRADDGLALLNLLLLGLVAFIPFPTSLLGEYGDRPLVVAFYALVLALAGIAGTICWAYVAKRGLLGDAVSRHAYRQGLLRGMVVPSVFLGSLLALPLVGTTATELLWLLVIPTQWAARRWARRWQSSGDVPNLADPAVDPGSLDDAVLSEQDEAGGTDPAGQSKDG